MFQKTIIVGNLGRDPEMRYTPSGVPVTTFSVAVNRRWTDQQGQPQEKTTWFRVTAWRKLAELCNQYLSKGRQVLVEGDIDASAWLAQDGQPRASLELTARTVRFLGGTTGEGYAPDSLHEGPAMEEGDIPF
ncbi:MAG: single-stranded DNA-binding protein [Chloroflexi bacterium]|nr:single-stranded DNA-binding protein [Chloroflexota bacterium]